MHTALVVGTAATGLIVGGFLDPIGQRLADRSRREETERDAAAAAPTGGEGGPDLSDTGSPAPDTGPPAPDTGPPASFVPTGRSVVRTTVASLLTGGLFAAAAAHFGDDLVVAPFCVLFALLVAVSMTDLSHRLVPRRLLYPAFGLIVTLLVASAGVDHHWRSLSGSAIAGAVAFGLFFTVWWFVPRGMGSGDVRLAGVIGSALGYLSLLHAYLAFLAGFVLGMVFGLVTMVVLGSGRKTRIPFAPALAVGAVVAVFFGAHWAQTFFRAPM